MLDNIKEKYPKKLEKCRYFLADKGYETKQFKDTNIVYNYKGKVYYITDSGKEIELLYKGYDKSRDSQRYGFHPKYEDKRIFRIPLKTDPRIFTKVARNSKKCTGKVYCIKVATAKIIPITIDFFIYTPIL